MPVYPNGTRRAVECPAFMTLQAHRRLLISIEIFHGHHQGWLLPWFLYVLAHGTVAGFTAPVGQGTAVFAVGEFLHEFLVAFQALAATIDLGRAPYLRI